MSVESSFAAALKPFTGMAVAGGETSIAPKRAIRATRVILTCFMGDSSVCTPNARSSTKVPSGGQDGHGGLSYAARNATLASFERIGPRRYSGHARASAAHVNRF